MLDPVAIVSTSGTVIETIQVGGTSVDREESHRRAAGARNCCIAVCSVAPGAGTGPAEEVLGPGICGGCGAIEGGAQTENFVDFVLYRGKQDAGAKAVGR